MIHVCSIPSATPARQNARRGGFTLIEMLVVVGIILLLIGMAVTGFSAIAKHSKAQHTKAVLEAAKAMLGEYEATAGKQNVSSFRNFWDSSTIPVDAGSFGPVGTKTTMNLLWVGDQSPSR